MNSGRGWQQQHLKREKGKKNSDGEIRQVLALSKFNNNVILHAKYKAWQAITSAVNSENVDKRTSTELKHTWKDLVSRAKKDLSARKRPQTGGGKNPPDSPYTDIVLDILGEKSPSLVGIVDDIVGETAVEDTTEAQVSVIEIGTEVQNTEKANPANVGKKIFLFLVWL